MNFASPNIRFAAIVAIGVSLAATAAQAQYVGPGSPGVATDVAAILAKPQDDQPVVLKGYLVEQLSSDKYRFSDGKNEIRVEIDRKRLPARPLDASTRIEIRGKVEKDFLQSPEIDVKALTVIE